MTKFRFYLTSIGCKILSVCVSIEMLILSGVLIYYYSQIPWYAILFAVAVTVLCWVACVICFTHGLVLDKQKNIITIITLKRKKIALTDIEKIEVDIENSIDPNKYCFITICLKESEQVKTSGFFSIIKKHDVQRTRLIVDEINKLITKGAA
ncbi:MAG: hypothetical protein K2N74_02075 [Clostridiales bacterium]|nr:hypothetical protein [Clostridiales bacterium]